jgi:glycosyltransferase involved in cell wall biosynthesis
MRYCSALMSLDFSVIIPTFRRPKELREAVASVLEQPGVTLEVIVVDDSPEGGAQQTVEAIGDPRVSYLKTPEPTKGKPGLVRNYGWPRATGKLCHFLDDDDVVPKGHYQRVQQTFAANPEVGVVFGIVQPFSADGRSMEHEQAFFSDAARRARTCTRFGPSLAFGARMFFEATMIVCSNCIVRRECVVALDGFDPEVRLVEDVDFYARAMRRFGAFFLEEVTLHYRIGPSLMHSRTGDEAIVTSYQRMHRKYREAYGDLDFYALKLFARLMLRLV